MLSDRYELVERLGSGGMAEVFLARDRVLDREVAVKVLAPHRAHDEDFVRRFRREARSAASLNHPNVVSVHDTGSDGDVHFIVMELVDGSTLETVIAERAPLPVDEVVDIVRQVSMALEAAHEAGLVHRDVKPGNVMFTAAGDVKVTDFGIALATAASRLTQAGDVYGSAAYLSPEQARGGDVDERADVYGLGCVTYEMLAGQPPYTGAEPVGIVYQHLHGDLGPPSAHRDGIPPDLERLVMRMLSRDPDDRYASATEVREDLERLGASGALGGAVGAGAAVAATQRLALTDDAVDGTGDGTGDETKVLAPADAAAPTGGDAGPPGTPSETSSDADTRPDGGASARWRTGLVAVAGIVLLALLLAGTVMRPDQGPEPLVGTPVDTPSPSPSPSPSPTTPLSVDDAVIALFDTVNEGLQQGELSEKAAEELRKAGQDALDRYRDGKLGEALEKLDEGRRKVVERAREGEIDADRAEAVLAAIDQVEEAMRRQPPPPDEEQVEPEEQDDDQEDEDEKDNEGRGEGGPPNGPPDEPPGQAGD